MGFEDEALVEPDEEEHEGAAHPPMARTILEFRFRRHASRTNFAAIEHWKRMTMNTIAIINKPGPEMNVAKFYTDTQW